MKRSSCVTALPLAALFAGMIGLLLHVLLFRFGMDSSGLLLSGHLLKTVLPVVAGLVIFAFFLLCRGDTPQIGLTVSAPATWAATIFAGIGIFLLGMDAWTPDASYGALLVLSLGAVAAVSLPASLAFPKLRGAGPVICSMFFAVHSVLRYRQNSSDPQLFDYLFAILAELSLTLLFYHTAAFQKGVDKVSRQAFWQASAITLCAIAIFPGGFGFVLLLPWLLLKSQEQ